MISNHRSIAFLIALCSLASTAQAADLAVRSAPSAVAPTAAFDWQRCYLGLHAGYRYGNSDNDFGAVAFGDQPSGSPVDFSSARPGGLVGAQGGCNLQPSGSLVFGIEGEISGASGRSHSVHNIYHIIDPFALNVADPWSADLALRVGMPVDRALIYLKGGLAYSHFDYTWGQVGVGDTSVTDHKDRFGGIVGAGVEYAISQNVSLKLEYDHFDYGKAAFSSPNFQLGRTYHARETNDVVKIGINYLLDGKGPVVAKY